MSFATQYRPTTFKDGFIGQEITAEILQNELAANKVKQILLFAGTSGSGKTTAARILAKEINHGIGNPYEIDAASNNGVDQVRAIVDAANERDLVGEYKVFIIDECHMITTAGWNAFLKCLEDCPKYTIFIFCTTDPQKIPQTVLNRMQRFNFAPVPASSIYERLIYICQQEQLINCEQTCDFLSKICKGSVRDAITMLEQVSDYSKDISMTNAKKVLLGLSYETMFKLTWALQNKNEQEVLSIIDELYMNGQDLKTFITAYLEFIINLSKFILFNDINLTSIPAYLATGSNQVVQFTVSQPDSLNYFNNLSYKLLDLKNLIKYDDAFKTTIEIVLLSLCRD